MNPIWLKASVVGSLWASIEIIIGSFLHNLRVPFSGTILSFMTVILIIAFVQHWRENGLIWRAGLICALMKSISPSAIILGPMTGIFMEALLLEFFILVFGRNLLGYITGGAAAVLSALFHKIFTLLILYGLDLVQIARNIYYYAVKQVHLEKLDPWIVVAIIVLIYLVAGSVAAVLGYITGKRKEGVQVDQDYILELEAKGKLFSLTTKQKYSGWLLLLHLLSIVLCLYLINYYPLVWSLPVIAIYLTFCIVRYKTSLRHLKKPLFWIQFAILTILASIFWSGMSKGNFWDPEGFMVGITMNIRAAVVLVGFSSLSVELKNPLIKAVLYKRGFANFYQSMRMAFEALPGLIALMPPARQFLRKPLDSLSDMILHATRLLPQLQEQHYRLPGVVIVTGEREQGKTTMIREIVDLLKQKNISPGGFLSTGIHTDGKRTGFRIESLKDGTSVELCTTNPMKGWQKTGKYYFNPDGISFGRSLLAPSQVKDVQLVIIDEIGPVELGGQGWAVSIEELVEKTSITQLWSVRKSLVDKVSRKWNISEYQVFEAGKNTAEEVVNSLKIIT